MTIFTRGVRRIVLGVDFSQPSITAAKWCTEWLGKDVEYILAHALVVPKVDGILSHRFPISDSLLSNARTGAVRRLREIATAFEGVNLSFEVGEGRPADVLQEIAQRNDAELVVVGRHGEGGVHRGYTGRTADRLVRASTVPVLVVDVVPSAAPSRILVPLTYSSITPYVIEWARRVYDLTNASVIATHVVGSAVLSHVLSMSVIRNGEPLTTTEIDEAFTEDRDNWKRELVTAGISASDVDAQVVFGEVSDAILAAADEHHAQLIVMGSHAGPVRRLLLGSAASAVLRQARCPVLIVTEPEESKFAATVHEHSKEGALK